MLSRIGDYAARLGLLILFGLVLPVIVGGLFVAVIVHGFSRLDE